MSATVVDTGGPYTTQQGYGRTSIVEYGGDLIRIEILVDAYAKQSYARVKLLSKHHTWEPLLEAPASLWHDRAPSYANRASDVAEAFTLQLQGDLVARARRVLDVI